MTVESLPRSESSLLAVKLDTLFLRDLTTQGTIFPFLVSPKTVKMQIGKSKSDYLFQLWGATGNLLLYW